MEMWDRTKSSLARVSQLADIQDKPENEDIEFEIFHCEHFQNIKQNNGTVRKLRKFSLTHFWQQFRESNSFTK